MKHYIRNLVVVGLWSNLTAPTLWPIICMTATSPEIAETTGRDTNNLMDQPTAANSNQVPSQKIQWWNCGSQMLCRAISTQIPRLAKTSSSRN